MNNFKKSAIVAAAAVLATGAVAVGPVAGIVDNTVVTAGAETNDAAARTINIVTDGNGSVSMEREWRYGQTKLPYGQAVEGDSIYLSAYANNGYAVSKLTVIDANGNVIISERNTEADKNQNFWFRMPDADITIKAEFEAVSYNLDYSDPANGYIEVFGEDEDEEIDESLAGKNVTVKLYPDDGYFFSGIFVVDKTGHNVDFTMTDDSTVNFVMPASEVKIEAAFDLVAGDGLTVPDEEEAEPAEDAVYTLNTVTNGYGRIATERMALGILHYGQAKANDFIRVKVADVKGHDLKNVTVTDKDGNVIFSDCDDQFYFTMPDGDVTITAEYE